MWHETTDHRQAEELLQDGLLITDRKLAEVSPDYRFAAWILTGAGRKASSHYRKQKPLVEEVEFAIETTASGEVMEQEWARSLWAHAKRLLTENHFTALRLFYSEGMTIDEVAAAMERKPNSVKVWLHRARKRLARELNPRPSVP